MNAASETRLSLLKEYTSIKHKCFHTCRRTTPRALKEAEGGEFIGSFEEIGFGRSFVDDAEAVKLHGVAVSVLVTRSELTRSHDPDYVR